MAVVTPDDVAVSLGRPISEQSEVDQVKQWIADAEMLIGNRLGDIAELDQPTLAYVVREAVALRAMNPDPSIQYEAGDDYRYGRVKESRRVTILDEWWNLLSPSTGQGFFSIRPTFEPDDTGNAFLEGWT